MWPVDKQLQEEKIPLPDVPHLNNARNIRITEYRSIPVLRVIVAERDALFFGPHPSVAQLSTRK